MPKRTICIAVGEIISGGTKSEFYSHLRARLKETVVIANVALNRLFKADDLVKEKFSADGNAATIAYRGACETGLGVGWRSSVASISKAIAAKYLQERSSIRIGRVSAPTFRSMPMPIMRSDGINVEWIEGVATATLKIGEKRFTLRLAGGSNNRDQLHGLKSATRIGDSKIWIDKSGKAIIGFCCDIPARSRGKLSGEMCVSSAMDSLIVATVPRSEVPFVITGDNMVADEKASKVRFQRLRQDSKSGANRRQIRHEMASLAWKNEKRKRCFCHEVSARIVNRARLKRVKTITVDFTIKSYAKNFPWFILTEMIKYKAEKFGIEVVVKTQAVSEPDVDKPHVYFKYSPATHRVKIGYTNVGESRHGSETDSAEDLVVLAVDNQPKSKTKQREKHFHAQFNDHRVDLAGRREWFDATPVLSWLRAVEWLGNAGNLSQIMQVLDVSQDASREGHLWAERERAEEWNSEECSHNAVSSEDFTGQPVTALAATETSFEC